MSKSLIALAAIRVWTLGMTACGNKPSSPSVSDAGKEAGQAVSDAASAAATAVSDAARAIAVAIGDAAKATGDAIADTAGDSVKIPGEEPTESKDAAVKGVPDTHDGRGK